MTLIRMANKDKLEIKFSWWGLFRYGKSWVLFNNIEYKSKNRKHRSSCHCLLLHWTKTARYTKYNIFSHWQNEFEIRDDIIDFLKSKDIKYRINPSYPKIYINRKIDIIQLKLRSL